ncbi:MAG: endolytic transglycosylase MltG [Crocinitomicaceae bacterium]|nr:endolytic transglycosylase MltG [Crocinitomicaceae bacterium]
MSRKQKLILMAGILILGATVLLFPKLKYAYAAFQKSSNASAVVIYLSVKESALDVKSVARLLQAKGVLSSTELFELVGTQKEMTARNIAPGKYIIEPGTAYRHIWNGFTLNSKLNGNAEQSVQVSIENCRTLQDLAGKLQKQLDLDSTELMAYLQNGTTLSNLGFTLEQLPVLFIPNTYELYWDQTPQQFVDRMAQEFKNFWTSARIDKLKTVGLNAPSEAVTLASIVYSEQSRRAEEWPVIAGLYLNRIKQGVKLQSDPTFKFCWGDQLKGVQRLLAVHRDIDCAYNTYKIQGLPPGPIYLPPVGVVEAVLNPDKNDYIFMCAKPDYSGTHNFTASGAEHAKNAKTFQNWLAAELRNR